MDEFREVEDTAAVRAVADASENMFAKFNDFLKYNEEDTTAKNCFPRECKDVAAKRDEFENLKKVTQATTESMTNMSKIAKEALANIKEGK